MHRPVNNPNKMLDFIGVPLPVLEALVSKEKQIIGETQLALAEVEQKHAYHSERLNTLRSVISPKQQILQYGFTNIEDVPGCDGPDGWTRWPVYSVVKRAAVIPYDKVGQYVIQPMEGSPPILRAVTYTVRKVPVLPDVVEALLAGDKTWYIPTCSVVMTTSLRSVLTLLAIGAKFHSITWRADMYNGKKVQKGSRRRTNRSELTRATICRRTCEEKVDGNS